MEEEQRAFAERYRRWINGQTPDARLRQELWKRVSLMMELGCAASTACDRPNGEILLKFYRTP